MMDKVQKYNSFNKNILVHLNYELDQCLCVTSGKWPTRFIEDIMLLDACKEEELCL
jgi:hypothetical protein